MRERPAQNLHPNKQWLRSSANYATILAESLAENLLLSFSLSLFLFCTFTQPHLNFHSFSFIHFHFLLLDIEVNVIQRVCAIFVSINWTYSAASLI